ncbi:MAG TPA: restriction endonuclease [Caulobacteraceae bacterium]|nr:restriction endonuclease [Caulobacteraceae bacterium]
MAKRDALPRYDDFFKPTLEALTTLGGSGSIEEIDEEIVSKLNIGQAALDAVYAKSGAPILPDRMSWARSYLKLAGLVGNPQRGVWVLTEEGRGALLWPDAKLRKVVADAYNASEAERRTKRAEQTAVGGTADGADAAGEELGWQDRLLLRLQTVEPAAFERLSQRMLRQSGFTRVEVTGKSSDGGIDGVGVLRVNLISFQVLFQCKRWKGSVGAAVVRDFRGAMQGRADKGLIITTGTFTTEARKEATRDGAPAIDLIDGEAMCDLLKDLRLGVIVREIKVEEVSLDENLFESI